MNSLPMTGTAALLEELSPFLPDDQINVWFQHRRGPGRPNHFSPAQLLRVLLLVLLTPAHSFNLLVALLPEQRTWRRFARLPNRRTLPDAKMLHTFRDQLSLTHLRQLNAQLLQPLLTGLSPADNTVALIDATDLPAATNSYKKSHGAVLGAGCDLGRAQFEEWPKPLVRRLQETHLAVVAASAPTKRSVGTVGVVGRPGPSR